MSALTLAAARFTPRRPFRALMVASSSALCAAYAGAVVPLSFGWAITQWPIQTLVVAMAVAGAVVGWFTMAGRALPITVAVAGVLSFAATVLTIAVLYPPATHG